MENHLKNPFIQLYLFRHGMTKANEEKLYCGISDLSLSPKGISSLKELKAKYIYPDLSDAVIYTSGAKRAEETLKILYPSLTEKKADSKIIREKGFMELNFGDFEMKSYDSLKDCALFQTWIKGNNEKNPCPHGESGCQMNERVLDSLNKVIKAAENRAVETKTDVHSPQNIAIFAHGGTISAIMSHFFPEEKKNRWEWQSDFGQGYKIQFIKDKSIYHFLYTKFPQNKENSSQ